jgi:hypothetical protein
MDEADYGSEREQAMLQAALEEFQYQLSQAGNEWPYGIGKCKNCGEVIDDSRPYCDIECASDFSDRLKANRRNGKYRGG